MTLAALPAVAQPVRAVAPLPSLDLAGYAGTWQQVALYPNKFQSQCVAQTSATYALRPDGQVSVTNRCRTAAGTLEVVQGLARPRAGTQLRDGKLEPASLEVSFLPPWLRWLPVGWGNYDVIQRLQGDTIAIVSEPSREYLWVLARTTPVSKAAWSEVQTWLSGAGFDLQRLSADPEAVER